MNPDVSKVEDSVNIGGGASIELIDMFCYRGDTLSEHDSYGYDPECLE